MKKEKGLTAECIETVKRSTNKRMNILSTLREENRLIEQKIKHVKELITSQDPAVPKQDDVSKNFENSSIRSGGGASIQGSVINEVQKNVNLLGALSTINQSAGDIALTKTVAKAGVSLTKVQNLYRKSSESLYRRFRPNSLMLCASRSSTLLSATSSRLRSPSTSLLASLSKISYSNISTGL